MDKIRQLAIDVLNSQTANQSASLNLPPEWADPNDKIIQAINTIRFLNKLPALQPDKRLNQSATAKAQDMTDKNYWSHQDPDGNWSWPFMDKAGYKYSHAGEDLAQGFNDQESVDAWMKSPHHKEQIMNPNYTDIGVGRVGEYNVLHFGKQ